MFRIFILASTVAVGNGSALAFECSDVRLPSSFVICSDPELIRLADKRQKDFDEIITRLPPQQRKELLADDQGWVNSYATACGVLPDKPAPNPVPVTVKACFKRATEARIAYLNAYGKTASAAQPSAPEAPAATAAPQAVTSTEKIGPSFDCGKAVRPLGKMICSNPELWQIDLH
jgi:uncharacterized protein